MFPHLTTRQNQIRGTTLALALVLLGMACSPSGTDDLSPQSPPPATLQQNLSAEANKKLGFESDLRHYGIGAQILMDLGIRKIKLLTNNPKKVVGLSGFDLEIVERVQVEVEPNDENRDYLETKRARMGHILGSCS